MYEQMLTLVDAWNLEFVGAAALAVLSFLLNGLLNRKAARRAASLQFIQDQLKYLYGPLYAITQSNDAIYREFKSQHQELVAKVLADTELTQEENQIRETWNQSVFQPSNLRMRRVIENNAHLFASETMPKIVLEFLAHVENWQAISRQTRGDSPIIVSEFVAYPEGFAAYVSREYERVSKRHAKKVGRPQR